MDPTKTPTWWREGYTPKYRFAYAGEGDTHLYDVTGFGDQGFTAQDLYGQTNATYYDPHNTDPQYQYDYQKFLTASSGEPGTGWALGDNAGQGQSIWGTLFSPENIAITAAGGILGAGAAGAAAQAAAAAGGGLGATLASNPSTYWAGLKAVQGLVGDQSAGSVLGTVGALGGTVVGAATGVPGLSTVGGVAGHQIGNQFESPQVQGVGGSFNSQAQGTGDARQVSARSQREMSGDYGDFNLDNLDLSLDTTSYPNTFWGGGGWTGDGPSAGLQGTQLPVEGTDYPEEIQWNTNTGSQGGTGGQTIDIPGIGKVPLSLLGSLLSGAGSLAGGLIQGGAATDAANTQAGAADRATQLAWQIYNTNRGDLAPFREAGVQALGQAQDLTGQPSTYAPFDTGAYGAFDPSPYAYRPPSALDPSQFAYTPTAALRAGDYQYSAPAALDPSGFAFKPPSGSQVLTDDPGYQFRLQQGLKALERQGAAGGLRLSGAQLKATQDYAQGQASQEYGAAYGRARDVNDLRYGRALQQNADQFQRGAYADTTNYGRALQENTDTYGRNLAGNQLNYERGVAQNETAAQRDLTANQLNFGRDYQHNADIYGRALTGYQTNFNVQQQQRAQRFNELASLAGIGQTTAGQLAQTGAQASSTIGNTITGAGNAQAAGQIGRGNALNQGISGVGGAVNQYLSYDLLNSLLQRR